MGLDIYVCKPINANTQLIEAEKEENLPNNKCSYSLTTHPILNKWKHLSFKKVIEYINFEKSFEKIGKNFDDYSWYMTGPKGTHFLKKGETVEFDTECEPINDVVITWDKAVTFEQEEDFIIVEEIGWQRKGANSLFYTKNETGESIWDSEPIVDNSLLNEHWEKYFSNRTPDAPGGFGSGVEYSQPDSKMRLNFKENIIDKFIEGETFVIYS